MDLLKTKEKPSEDQKASENKSKKMKGSVDSSYELDAAEANFVHYEVTDYASPRPKDLNETYTPQKHTVKSTPQMFVMQFADNYISNEAFLNVNTPGKIVAIMKNMKKEHIEEAYGDEIVSATQNKRGAKQKYVSNLLKKKKTLLLCGSNRKVDFKDIKHIPTSDPNFPFDPKDLDKFPEECLYQEDFD